MNVPYSIILAAGRGTRLSPLAKPFEKPLFLVGGKPLFMHAVEFAVDFGARIVTVASPITRDRLVALSPIDTITVTQIEPLNIVDAIRIGLHEIPVDASVMILCSDNVFAPSGAWFRAQINDRAAIGIRRQADPSGALTRIVDGILTARSPDHLIADRWIGPVYIPNARSLKQHIHSDNVESFLNEAGAPFDTVPMNCADFGVDITHKHVTS